jgi:hypothetical protein
VTRLDQIGLAGTDLRLGAVLVPHGQTSGLDDADVPDLAAVGAGDGLHALGPLPSRLEREPGRRRVAEANDVHARLLRGARLVGGIEIEQLNTGHLKLLS